MSLLKFSVSGKSENETKFIAKAREFELVIDEPPSLGGKDEAANPVEYLLASYAGCLNVVGFIVAKEQGIELRSLEINIEGDLDPSRFLGLGFDARSGFQHIEVELKADSDASEEALTKWAQTVESRCPISDNLSQLTPIQIQVGNKDKVFA
ncbi:MAG: OsmC family protein [Bacteroidota bacterium]